MKLHFFSVTAEDIEEGAPRSMDGCPVVIALRRSLKAISFYESCPNCYFTNDAIPKEMKMFIWRFDRGLPVEPQRFSIDLDLAGRDTVTAGMRMLRTKPVASPPEIVRQCGEASCGWTPGATRAARGAVLHRAGSPLVTSSPLRRAVNAQEAARYEAAVFAFLFLRKIPAPAATSAATPRPIAGFPVSAVATPPAVSPMA